MNLHQRRGAFGLRSWKTILGITVASLDWDEAIGLLRRVVVEKRFTKVSFLNAHNANIACVDREFAEALDRRAAAVCAPHRDDPLLLGCFTDNELRWGPDWRSADTLLATFFSLPEAAPGKAAAVAAVAERYADVDTLNQAWGSKLASLDDLRRLEKLADASLSLIHISEPTRPY